MMNIPDRIYAQYRGKPKTEAWLNITPTMIAPLVDTAAIVRNMYDIDAMSGAQLEVIGRVVVISRTLPFSTLMVVSELDLTDGGECGDMGAMCSATSIDDDTAMSDELYRIVIRAKIIKNNSDATIESILSGINFLLPNAQVMRLVDGENMTFSIEFYGNITELERWALVNARLVPKPQGVRFSGFLEGAGYVESGDTDMECGDTSAECVGFTGV